MSKIYLEILDKERQRIFDQLSAFSRIGYLAGGTALALQISHRKSLDFDIFVKNPINNYLRLKAKKIFGLVNYYVNTGDQISFKTNKDISITFVWYYYKTVYPLVKTHSLPLASFLDIAADKAHTIGRRAAWRDYVDFFFLLKKKLISIEKVIELAQKKFVGEFIDLQFIQQLSYFADLKETPIEYLEKSYTSNQIKSFLEAEVSGYVDRKLGRGK